MDIQVFSHRFLTRTLCVTLIAPFCVALLSASCGDNGGGGVTDGGSDVSDASDLGSDADAGGNQAPNGVIDLPAGDVTITAGDSIHFGGTGSDPDGDLPLGYLWRFGAGSGIPDSSDEDPGLLQFDNPGEHIVSFTVTDSRGLSDPTPDTRTITVVALPTCDWYVSPAGRITVRPQDEPFYGVRQSFCPLL